MIDAVTTVPVRHTSDLERVLHLLARHCPGSQGAWGNQLSPHNFAIIILLSYFKTSSKTDLAVGLNL